MTKRLLVAAFALAALTGWATPVRATAQSGAVNGAAGNISGTMTAGFFVGNGAGLTNVSVDLSTVTSALAMKASTGTCTLPLVMVQTSSTAVTCVEPSDVSGNAATASSLAAAPSATGSGFLARGVNASGNALPAAVDASAVSGSTNPVQSGGVYTALAGKAATFIGISSACAAGQYLSTATIVNGVITGGGCVPASSGGDTFQAGNNAFTGNNTHAGQENLLAGSTGTVSQAAVVNWVVRVASGDAVNVTTVTITSGVDLIFYSSYTYRLDYQVQAGTAALSVGVNPNCDMGANYYYSGNGGAAGGSATNEGGSGDFTIGLFWGDVAQVLPLKASGIGGGSVNFAQDYGGGNGVLFWSGSSSGLNNGSAYVTDNFGGHYAGSAPMTSLCITTSSAFYNTRFTGRQQMNVHWEVWQIGQRK